MLDRTQINGLEEWGLSVETLQKWPMNILAAVLLLFSGYNFWEIRTLREGQADLKSFVESQNFRDAVNTCMKSAKTDEKKFDYMAAKRKSFALGSLRVDRMNIAYLQLWADGTNCRYFPLGMSPRAEIFEDEIF